MYGSTPLYVWVNSLGTQRYIYTQNTYTAQIFIVIVIITITIIIFTPTYKIPARHTFRRKIKKTMNSNKIIINTENTTANDNTYLHGTHSADKQHPPY
jgi:glucan phosphoethanolaminetransferase (alkaline phosphatase superfamily)